MKKVILLLAVGLCTFTYANAQQAKQSTENAKKAKEASKLTPVNAKSSNNKAVVAKSQAKKSQERIDLENKINAAKYSKNTKMQMAPAKVY